MKKVHISFGDESYSRSLLLLKETSLQNGKIDEFVAYTKEALRQEDFWKKNAFILEQKRGAGYWVWKPYIILKTMDALDEGDIVLYTDAGLMVLSDLTPLFNIADAKDRVIFKLPAVGVDAHKCKTWTKRDCFVLMGSDEKKYWEADMGNGAVSLWKKTEENIDLLKEWLRFLRDPRISTDSPNVCGPNHIGFRDHRHDQSVLSIIATREGWELFRDPTQWGNKETDKFNNSPYGQLFHHHRNFKH